MHKAILEFKLPEERSDFDLAINTEYFRSLLFRLNNELKSKIILCEHKDNPYNLDKKTLEFVKEYLDFIVKESDLPIQF